jgi:[ribosomal protein S5]-alanine N-acetyltransferase
MPNLVIANTERLLIRPLQDTDITALANMLADPEVMRFSVNGIMTREASQRFLD